MRFTLFIITLFLSGHVSSLTAEQVITKMRETQQNADQISYESTYELFKGHNSNTVHTSYSGKFYRNQKGTYQKIKNTEFVYGNDFSLQISHGEKAMVLSKSSSMITRDIDLSSLLKNSEKTDLKEVSGNYVVTVTYKSTVATPFTKVKLTISKGEFHLKRLNLYYRVSQNFSSTRTTTDMHQPHLQIRFKNIKMNESSQRSELLTLSTYISKKNNILNPTGKCLGYELIDNRIK